MGEITDEQYQEAAFRLYHRDGEVEVDIGAGLPTGTVSRSEDSGAYVLGWIWVSDEDVNG